MMSLTKKDSTAALASLLSYGGGDSEPDSDDDSKTTGRSSAKRTSKQGISSSTMQGLVSYDDDRQPPAGASGDTELQEVDVISDDDLPQIHGLSKVDLLLNASTNSECAVALSESIRRTCSVDESDVRLPPEPTGRCSKHLQDKITTYYKKRFNLNHIQKRKDFRNPSIYDKLISYLRIDEFGSNYPSDVFDAHGWDESSYYEALAKLQKEDMARREKEKKERTKVEFKMGMVKKMMPILMAASTAVSNTTATASSQPPTATAAATAAPPAAAVTTAPPLLSVTTSHSLPATSSSDEPERKRKSKWGVVPPSDTIRPLLPLPNPPYPITMVTRPTTTSIVGGLVTNPAPIIPIIPAVQQAGVKTTVIPAMGVLKKAKSEK